MNPGRHPSPVTRLGAALACWLYAVMAWNGCGGSSSSPEAGSSWRWDASLPDSVNLARADSLITYGFYSGMADELERKIDSLPLATRPDSLLLADLVDLRVGVLWQSGRWHDRETGELSETAVSLRRKLHGPEAIELDQSLFNRGVILTEQGRYEAAGPYFQELVRVRRKHLGAGPETARALNALGNWCWFRGDIQGARDNYEAATGMLRELPEPDPIYLGIVLGNLASMLVSLGEHTGALEYSRESVAAFRDISGPPTFHLADAYVTHAENLLKTASAKDIRPFVEKAVEIYDDVGFEGHYFTCFSENLLAVVSREAGAFDDARAHYSRALSIAEEAYGPASPIRAALQINLATLESDAGEHREAIRTCGNAVAALDSMLTPEHPLAIHARSMLAIAYLLDGQPAKAMTPALVADQAARNWAIGLVGGMSEREALQFESGRISGLDVLLSALAEDSGGAGSTEATWDALVRSRGLVLDEVASRRRYLETVVDRELEPLLEAHDASINRLARLVHVAMPGADFRRRLQEELRVREELERDIASRSLAHRDLRERDLLRRNLGLQDIRNRIPPRAALAAFVRYHRMQPAEPDRARQPLGERYYCTLDAPGIPFLMLPGDPVDSYAAFVIPASGGRPRFVPLGEAGPVDRAVQEWRESLEDSTDATTREAKSRALRSLAWDPLAPHLADAELTFLVPDGALNLVAFDALVTEDQRFLLEEAPLLHYLSSERDLVRAPRPGGEGALFVGGPEFGGLVPFVPLPAAESEARELAVLLGEDPREGFQPVSVLTGGRATEAEFARLAPGRRIVHLATHAFTTPDLLGDLPPNYQPLQLSGLAFAGANLPPGDREPREDGILHAEEVAALRLSAAEWVVLSACESGVGSVQAREGVLGLRRAFESSDARTLIMSLWKVEDDATRTWMRHLYEARLAGASTPQAMQAASLRTLEDRRRAGLGTDPRGWAAFVAVGDWQ